MKRLPLYVLLLQSTLAFCQIGGLSTYHFLRLPTSARTAALGGSAAFIKDNDVALAWENPAALNPLMHNQFTLNHTFNFAGISNGYLGYGFDRSKQWGVTLHAGMQYINYGNFDGSDEFGNINSNFKAAEYAFNIGAGRQLSEHLSVGINAKAITSRLESYSSFGLGADIAGMYNDTSKRFTVALVFNNVGAPITTYTAGDDNLSMPFNISFAVAKRLRYLPLRFSVTAHNLQRWNLLYENPDLGNNNIFIEGTPTRSAFQDGMDNFFRHLLFSSELLLGKRETIRLRIGYNHLRRKELSVSGYRSLAGFSGGIGIKVNRFRLDYGFGNYHLAGRTNHITISTDIDDFRKAKTKLD